ncbi:hypothetical protein GCM10023196_036400 [Actinoallomurus vinaceus]|uniref:Uncharacterized protein n=1 Tax=Actinoallomurus vinaceus TaxID=1080074 RepID=A0ABP8U936_9ACTN
MQRRETIAGDMAEQQRKPRSADRHKQPRPEDRHAPERKGFLWRPRPDRVKLEDANTAAKAVSANMTEWLTQSAEYLLGLRKHPPPRPEWAERKAQELPDE